MSETREPASSPNRSGVGEADIAYPEHEKLRAVADLSQELGEFIDVGLPAMGIVLCEDTRWGLQPTHRSVQSVLARYFGIDRSKLDAEKADMLVALREANAR